MGEDLERKKEELEDGQRDLERMEEDLERGRKTGFLTGRNKDFEKEKIESHESCDFIAVFS